MILKQVLDVLDAVDTPTADGEGILRLFEQRSRTMPQIERVEGSDGSTDFVQVMVPGTRGNSAGGDAPTLGIVGRLGGLGARPDAVGFVSDGDGAVSALSAALKLAEMKAAGDRLQGDVIISTHVCPDAPTRPHDPVPFMGSPVDMTTMNRRELASEMDAVISIDTTKGNRLVSHNGIALTPPVKEGWILPPMGEVLDLYQTVVGLPPVLLAIATQDITPYGNGVHHVNSILQPATATAAPVIGVAITAATTVPGSATGASREAEIALAATFAVEAAKRYGSGTLSFYDEEEFHRLGELYGSLEALQNSGLAGRDAG